MRPMVHEFNVNTQIGETREMNDEEYLVHLEDVERQRLRNPEEYQPTIPE